RARTQMEGFTRIESHIPPDTVYSGVLCSIDGAHGLAARVGVFDFHVILRRGLQLEVDHRAVRWIVHGCRIVSYRCRLGDIAEAISGARRKKMRVGRSH